MWQKNPLALYFLQNFREVWRMPFKSDGSPSGPAERWLAQQGRLEVSADGLSINPSDDRLLATLSDPKSDIWLVEIK